MAELGSHWLSRERLRVYPRVFASLFVLVSGLYFLSLDDLVDGRGLPVGADFVTFWAASYLGLAGRPTDAYSIPMIAQAERIAVPGIQSTFAWFHPPSFFLLILPVALLPYLAALIAFMGTTLAGFLTMLARVVRRGDAKWLIAGFPGVWLCLLQGQTGLLTAALAAGALVVLPRRPLLAGLLIGLLTTKPQLAILFPIALVASGAWVALAAAMISGAVVLGAAVAVLGVPILPAWVQSLALAKLGLESGALPWAKSPSAFAMARLLGAPAELAYVMQGAVAALAIVVVWKVWRGGAPMSLKSAALMAGVFLVTPYSFDYDLVWLAFPIAWLALDGLRTGWRTGDREILAATWVLPVILAVLAVLTHVQIAPLVIGALLWAVARRATTQRPGTVREDPDRGGRPTNPSWCWPGIR